jgi:hypothetical protein
MQEVVCLEEASFHKKSFSDFFASGFSPEVTQAVLA